MSKPLVGNMLAVESPPIDAFTTVTFKVVKMEQN